MGPGHRSPTQHVKPPVSHSAVRATIAKKVFAYLAEQGMDENAVGTARNGQGPYAAALRSSEPTLRSSPALLSTVRVVSVRCQSRVREQFHDELFVAGMTPSDCSRCSQPASRGSGRSRSAGDGSGGRCRLSSGATAAPFRCRVMPPKPASPAARSYRGLSLCR
jgi:hypothetical protein